MDRFEAGLESAKGAVPSDVLSVLKGTISALVKAEAAFGKAGPMKASALVGTKVPKGVELTSAEQKKVEACHEAGQTLLEARKAADAAHAALSKALRKYLPAAVKCVQAQAAGQARKDKAKAKKPKAADKDKAKAAKKPKAADKDKAKAAKKPKAADKDKPKAAKKPKAADKDKPKAAKKPKAADKPKAVGRAAAGAGGSKAEKKPKRPRAPAVAPETLGLPSKQAKVIWKVTVATNADAPPADLETQLAAGGSTNVTPASSTIASHADVFTTPAPMTRKQFETELKGLMGAYRASSEDGLDAVDTVAWSQAELPTEGDYTPVHDVRAAFAALYK